MTRPVTIYLLNNGGEILLSETTNKLNWTISGTIINPLKLTSYSERATIVRSQDNTIAIDMEGVNYFNVEFVNFKNVRYCCFQLMDCHYNLFRYNSFEGGTEATITSSKGVFQIQGDTELFQGLGVHTSSNNSIEHNLFFNLFVTDPSWAHQHGAYNSIGSYDNKFKYNQLHYPVTFGLYANHFDYVDNEFAYNLCSVNPLNIYYSGFGAYIQEHPELGYAYNDAVNTIHGNSFHNNYTYDSTNPDDDGVMFNNTTVENNTTVYDNYISSTLYPNDPYWMKYDATKITDKVVSGDFDHDGKEDDIAAFYDYGTYTKIHVWTAVDQIGLQYHSSSGWKYESFSASKITGRVVCGDFDSDGYKDDIAAFYDNGNNQVYLYVWESTGNSFNTKKLEWATTTNAYDANKITNRVVSGDFDRDGKHDDIAAFYDYGNRETRIHVWLGSGSSLNYQYSVGWWTGTSFDANQITGKVVSGDFNRDGKHDDIASMYYHGGTSTSIFVWKSSGSSFPSVQTWWNNTSYNSSKVTGRLIAGDFDDDLKNDDLAAFFDYGNNETAIHIWRGYSSIFSFQGTAGWWHADGYDANKITGRIVAGDFDEDGEEGDIIAFYDYNSMKGNIRTHTWIENDYSFKYFNYSLGYPWLTNYSYYPTNPLPFKPVKPATISEKYTTTNYNKIDLLNNSEINIYPNPVKNQITFDFGENPETIQIYNIVGKLVYSNETNTSKIELQIGNYQNGTYIYKVIFKDRISTGKFIKD